MALRKEYSAQLAGKSLPINEEVAGTMTKAIFIMAPAPNAAARQNTLPCQTENTRANARNAAGPIHPHPIEIVQAAVKAVEMVFTELATQQINQPGGIFRIPHLIKGAFRATDHLSKR